VYPVQYMGTFIPLSRDTDIILRVQNAILFIQANVSVEKEVYN
jgi:hypothetical protein